MWLTVIEIALTYVSNLWIDLYADTYLELNLHLCESQADRRHTTSHLGLHIQK